MLYLIALVALLLSAAPAHAAFLIAPILAAIGFSAATVAILAPLAAAALSIGLSLLLAPKRPGQQDPGVEISIRADPSVPQSLIVGRAVLAGSRVGIESYGTKNQNCIEFIGLADHPCEGLVTAYVEAQEAELTDTATDRGFTVDGYDGKLALRFFDGSQTAVDTYAESALSSHPDRPWTSNHKGLGRTYARIHYVYEREKVPGPLPWKFVVDGIRLYDPRLDTTVGGSGAHRWGDLSTHEWTANLAVIAYNILRGIRVENSAAALVHFYGLEGTAAEALPLDNWFAAMNEADDAVGIGGSPPGTEPKYHGGLEIPVNTEPLEIVRAIITATGGRFVEIGGIYKIYLDAPGLPAASFDDGIIPANRSDLFEPVTPLEQKVTYITGSFVSPEDDWVEKVPPPRVDAAAETAFGRRIEADINAPMVQSPRHMQRLMKQVLARSARQRRHTLPLPPALFGVEPGDVLEWDSDRNGYTAKLFEVTGCEIDANLITIASLLEIDPDDYDWEAGDALPQAIGSLIQNRPAPKIIDDFDAQPYLHEGDGGRQRAGIIYTWTPPDDDDLVRFRVQIRLASTPTEIVNHYFDEPEAGQGIVLSGLAPGTEYETRGRPESFNGYGTDWSLWLPVTTPIIAVDTDIVEIIKDSNTRTDELVRRIRELAAGEVLADISDFLALDRERTERRVEASGLSAGIVNESVLRITEDEALAAEITSIFAAYGGADASVITGYIASVTSDLTALAEAIVLVEASVDDVNAQGLLSIISSADEEGGTVDIALRARVTEAGNTTEVGLYMGIDGEGYVALKGDQVFIIDGNDVVRNALMFPIQDEAREITITDEGGVNVIRPNLSAREQRHKVLLTADSVMRAPIGVVPMDYSVIVTRDSDDTRTLDWDPDVFIAPVPVLEAVPNAIHIIRHSVVDMNPLIIRAALDGAAFTTTPTMIHKQTVTFGVSNSSGSHVPTLSLAGVDFLPGDLLICSGYAMRVNIGGPFGSNWPLSNGAPADWGAIASAFASLGSIADRWGITSFYKFAAGDESTITPFTFGPGTGGATEVRNRYTAHVYVFRFLGGSVELIGSPTAQVLSGGSAHGTQTVPATGLAAPVLAVSYAGLSSTAAGITADGPDQVFSETPDDDQRSRVAEANYELASRGKFRLFASSPADVTTSYDPANTGTFRHGLMSFGFKMTT